MKLPILLCLSLFLGCLPLRSHAGVSPTNRTRQTLAEGWHFSFGSFQDPQKPEFDDSTWEAVTVPHTWNVKDGADGGNDYQRGTGWYRLWFTPEGAAPGRRSYLRLTGVGTVSTLWLNGKEVGHHNSAYSAACYDVTELLRPGKNLLVVCADNSPNPDIPPLSADYTFYGGIYRNVYFETAPTVSLDLLDHASPGVYLSTPTINDQFGSVRARLRIRNSDSQERDGVVTVTVLNPSGKKEVSASRPLRMKAGEVAEPVLDLTVPKPHLWNGRKDPYLYQVKIEVASNGQLDQVLQPLGFRTIKIDLEKGCLLNGKPYDLHGVNLHQDRAEKGWATSAADRDEDIRSLYDMGSTFVRFAHYQNDDSNYALCDRLGLLVWAENSFVDAITWSDAFFKNNVDQLTDLIRQCSNHPSILTWSISNEVVVHPPKGRDRNELFELLDQTVKTEDPSRPSCMARRHMENHAVTDLVGFNAYFGWYTGPDATGLAPYLDQRRQLFPNVPIGISEYGAGAGIHQHGLPPKKGHSEEWQNSIHETAWLILKGRPWLWCKLVWVFCDFAADKRNEGDHPGINDKGLVTRDRKVKKDAYYWYQANWTEVPMVYITSRRFEPRTNPQTEVKIYSNCDAVELFLNNVSQGTRTPQDCRAIWDSVTLAQGENQVSAVARKGGKIVKDSCVWTCLNK